MILNHLAWPIKLLFVDVRSTTINNVNTTKRGTPLKRNAIEISILVTNINKNRQKKENNETDMFLYEKLFRMNVWGSFVLGESKRIQARQRTCFKGIIFNIKIKYLSDFGSKEDKE